MLLQTLRLGCNAPWRFAQCVANPATACKQNLLRLVVRFFRPGAEFRHAHLFRGDNTGSRYLLRPPFAKNTKYQGSFRITGARTYNTLPRIIRQVETLREFKSAILNSNACSTCCLCNLINCLVLMSLFLCCVRAPSH